MWKKNQIPKSCYDVVVAYRRTVNNTSYWGHLTIVLSNYNTGHVNRERFLGKCKKTNDALTTEYLIHPTAAQYFATHEAWLGLTKVSCYTWQETLQRHVHP